VLANTGVAVGESGRPTSIETRLADARYPSSDMVPVPREYPSAPRRAALVKPLSASTVFTSTASATSRPRSSHERPRHRRHSRSSVRSVGHTDVPPNASLFHIPGLPEQPANRLPQRLQPEGFAPLVFATSAASTVSSTDCFFPLFTESSFDTTRSLLPGWARGRRPLRTRRTMSDRLATPELWAPRQVHS